MLFKFPQKKIVLDCFTSIENYARIAPIDMASKYMPEWWKNLPSSYQSDNEISPRTTMRYCTGFVDLYRYSVAIPMWTETIIRVDASQKSIAWQFSDQITSAVVHEPKQRGSYCPYPDYIHLKINSPWYLRTKEPMRWVWSCPPYDQEKPESYFNFPGIIDFYNQHETNLHFGIPLKKNGDIKLELRQVFGMLTPMSDRKVKVVRHVVSEEEIKKFRFPPQVFVKRYIKLKKDIQDFSGCPYTGGLNGKN
jgi:hypothetical protein